MFCYYFFISLFALVGFMLVLIMFDQTVTKTSGLVLRCWSGSSRVVNGWRYDGLTGLFSSEFIVM